MSTTSFGRSVGGVQLGVTAGATQSQAGATAITGAYATVTTVTTANDGVILPADRVKGDKVVIANLAAANSLRIYPNVGGTINKGTANQKIDVAVNKVVEFIQLSDNGLVWVAQQGEAAAAS
jgi:hypothetical protein